MASSPSNPFTIRVIQAVTLGVSFTLASTTAGTFPFTLGHVFRKGEVPAGTYVAASIPDVQVIPKNTWSDGSLKFAVISGRSTLAANTPLTVRLTRTTVAPGAGALTTDDLKATGITASIGADSYGTASWSTADFGTPFMQWTAGPQMSSWIYRKPVGSDAHLVGWLEVRLYADGAVEVLPWIENGYLMVPGPSNRSATYTFTLGASQRFSAAIDLPNHTRTVLLSGTAYSYWLGTPVAVQATPDKAYLQSTGLVPTYRASVSANSSLWPTLPQSFQPHQRGSYSTVMGNGGYQPAIGILPEWDVIYLCSDDPRALSPVIFNAYSGGRFGTHYRDEATQQPIRFSSYPNLVIGGGSSGIDNLGASTKNQYTPTSSGTAPPTWDSPHHPSIGYLAYFVTGRFYFMEEVQFVTTTNYLKNPDQPRQGSNGIFMTTSGANTTRGAAWALRTLAQAAVVTPDSDTVLRTEMLNSMAANVEYYHSGYVAQPNNPQGFVAPYSNYDASTGNYLEAAWMQDFFTAAMGYVIDLDLAMPAATKTKLSAFFAWKAQSIIGRLGGTDSTDYLYRDAAVYTVAVAPTTTPDYTTGKGPWFKNWGEVYAATLNQPNPGTPGDLRGAYFPEPTSYWANLQPAIAYAAQHKVPGALDAYNRMVGASNWDQMVSRFNNTPVWSVMPRST